MKTALDAFGEADFSWVKPLESIWSDADATIRGPNETLEDGLVATLLQQTKDASRKPPGRVLVGQAGMGVDGAQVDLATNLLPRHTAIIAGAGSGKTVLLRRIVEEAALARIPAIVIDPNNDLSRFGDAWPERPAGFTAEDEAKARRYAESVDVLDAGSTRRQPAVLVRAA
jgi:hypothetical protein